MAKFKFKINENTNYRDAFEALEELKKTGVSEIPFNYLLKITDFLDCEYLPKKGTGSSEHFRHKCLVGHSHYTGGFFQVHVEHKKRKMVKKLYFKKFFYPPLVTIINILLQQEQNEKK